MLQWPPDRSTILFLASVLAGGTWAGLTIAGDHPDGSILGLAGTCLVAWSTTAKSPKDKGKK